MERYLLGTQLTDEDRRHVLSAYVHRHTAGSMPKRTDAEWLAATRFFTRQNGRLDLRFKRCETTWTPEQLAEGRRNAEGR